MAYEGSGSLNMSRVGAPDTAASTDSDIKIAAENKELSKYSVAELKKFLGDKGLPAAGNKPTLICAINEYFSL